MVQVWYPQRVGAVRHRPLLRRERHVLQRDLLPPWQHAVRQHLLQRWGDVHPRSAQRQRHVLLQGQHALRQSIVLLC